MTATQQPAAAKAKRTLPPVKESGLAGIDLSSIRTEVDIVVLGLLMNLGFLKITEISTFIAQVSAAVTGNNLLVIIGVGVVLVAYFVYAASIALGLYFVFNRKSARVAMIVSLMAFFVVYIFMFWSSVSASQVGPQKPTAPATVATPVK